MLRQQILFTTLLISITTAAFNVFGQNGTVEVKEHYYENIHLINYPSVFFESRGNEMMQEQRYEFEVFPGGDVSAIQLSFENCDNIELMANGGVAIINSLESIFESAPIAYQEDANGNRIDIEAHFVLTDHRVSIEIGPYEMSQVLTIEMKSVHSSLPPQTSRGLDQPQTTMIMY